MTDEERQRDRAAKREVSEYLTANGHQLIDEWQHIGADPRLWEYVAKVCDDPDGHNLYEQLGVARFFGMLHRHTFDRLRVKRFIVLYEALRFSGTTGRQSYKLTPIQVFQYSNIFGFLDDEGRRLCRTAYIFVPRKFSKTTSTAAVAIYDMLRGDNNAQVYIGANSYNQAKILFNEIREIIWDIDDNGKHFQNNREKITSKIKGRNSFIQCLTANARTQDGLFASLVIMDEYAQARNTAGKNGADLRNVLTSSMGPRREPLTMIITTASDVIDGPFAKELEGVKAVLRGEAENELIFASLFMPDVDDAENDPKTWAKVQPHLGVTVQPDFYEKEYATACLSADNMLAFRTKLLNIFAQNDMQAWISSEFARGMMRHLPIESLKGRPQAMVAIDLSESDDFSAITCGVYDATTHDFYLHTAYFFPDGALKGHPNERLYRVWAQEGHLTLTHGDVINYQTIVEYILWLNEHVTILSIGYDNWKSLEIVNMLAAAGAKNVLNPVGQTYGHFTAPVDFFEHKAKTGKIAINDNPINAYCFGNAVIDEDRLENKKPIKRSKTMKIDGVITMLMCIHQFIHFQR